MIGLATEKDETVTLTSKIQDAPTPCLILDREKMEGNIKRMAGSIKSLGCVLRPHVKTHKSADVLQAVRDGGAVRGISVSTLREAAFFFGTGETDILYAVGMAPNKFVQAADLMRSGCDLKVLLDSVEMAELINEAGVELGVKFKPLIELNTDGHRSGIVPDSPELLKIAQILDEGEGAVLGGVLTHAGASYDCRSPESLRAMARRERDETLFAVERLREAGFGCPIVSIGSTPTALNYETLAGVTEVRAGVYVFFDLVMAGIGVCAPDDIAISVLVSVIGHQKEKNKILTDGGWMALSRDRGTASQPVDRGYGLVTDINGKIIDGLMVESVSQEHGAIGMTDNGGFPFEQCPIGSLLRILPNHACAASSQHDKYYVVSGGKIVDEWSRINGW